MPEQPPHVHEPRLTRLSELKPHPRNYRSHPDDQRRHIAASMREHGMYRNVVVARDGTILAGHGVVESAAEEGLEAVPAVWLELEPDDPRALKLLTADNELARFAVVDDRVLADLLREIGEADIDGLLGTGYDEAMLANLVFVTRPESEIPQRDDAAQWVGLPGYDQQTRSPQLIINFEDESERATVLKLLGIDAVHNRQRRVWAVWWPPRERDDVLSVRFTTDGEAA